MGNADDINFVRRGFGGGGGLMGWRDKFNSVRNMSLCDAYG